MPLGTSQRRGYQEAQNSGQVASLANAPEQLGSDEQKYRVATALAQDSLAGQQHVNKNVYKHAIDKYFDQLGGSVSGAEMRGENKLTQFIDDVNSGVDGINSSIGTLLDNAWDNTVGNAVGAVAGKDLGDAVKNFASGEDLALIPDIAADVVLTASGYGIPLVVLKEAFRNKDNLTEALTGRDTLTRQKLTGDQAFARGLLGLGGVALSALPGIGKIKSVTKNLGNEAAEDALKASQKALGDSEKALGGLKTTADKELEKLGLDDAVQAEAKRQELVEQAKELADLARSGRRSAAAEKKAISEAKPGSAIESGESFFEKVKPGESSLQAAKEQQAITDEIKKFDSFQKALDGYKKAKVETERLGDVAKEAEAWADKGKFRRAHQKMREETSPFFNELGDKAAYEQAISNIETRNDLLQLFREANDVLDKIPAMKRTASAKQNALREAYKQRIIKSETEKAAQELAAKEASGKGLTKSAKSKRSQTSIETRAENIVDDELRAFLEKAGASGLLGKTGASGALDEAATKDALNSVSRRFGNKFKEGGIAGFIRRNMPEEVLSLVDKRLPPGLRAIPQVYQSALRSLNPSAYLGVDDIGKVTTAGAANARKIKRIEKLNEKNSKFADVLKNIELDKLINPTGIKENAKDVAIRGVGGISAMGLANMAETGQPSPIPETGQIPTGDMARYLLTFLPVGTGKNLARSTLQTPRGRLGAQLPYGALYAKDVAHSVEDSETRHPQRTSYSEALNAALNK